MIDADKTCIRIAKENGIGKNTVIRNESYAAGIDAAEAVLPGIRQEILSGEINPTHKDIAAMVRAPEDDRAELAEKLRKPRAPTRAISSSQDETEEPKVTVISSIAGIREISERMESSPDRERPPVDTEFIILELGHALESMMYRWDTCIAEYPEEAAAGDCQREIRNLAEKGIGFLKKYIGRSQSK